MSEPTTAARSSVDVRLSAEAAAQVRVFLQNEGLDDRSAGLRVSVLPGGCSGFQYSLEVEEEPQGDDFVVESEGIKLFVDPFSAQYLAGIRIGYTSSFQGSGFTFDNPNATGGCGCGSSFSA